MERNERAALTMNHLDSLLFAASGAHAEYIPMTAEYIASLPHPALVHDNHGAQLQPGVEYIAIICPNKHRYYVNVDGDSLLTACAEAINLAARKL